MKLQKILRLCIAYVCLLAILTGCGGTAGSTVPDGTSGGPATDQTQNTTESQTVDTTQDTTQDTTESQITDATQDTTESQTTDATQDTTESQTTDATQDATESQPTDTTQDTTESQPTDATQDTSKPQNANSLLVGTWHSVRREENPYTNSASLITDSITFNADGTGWCGGFEYVVLPDIPMEETDTGDGWSVAPMGYEPENFTYTLEGSQLTVNYVGNPVTGGMVNYTKVFTVSRLDGNCLVIDNRYGTYLLGDCSLKALCAALNVDYSLPKGAGEAPDKDDSKADALVGTWSSVRGEEYGLYVNNITFRADGTGAINDCDYVAYYIIYPDMPIEETKDGWAVAGRSYETMYITYSLDGNQLSITYLGYLDVETEPICHTEVYTVSHLGEGRLVINDEYGTYIQGNCSLKELCAALGVDYTIPNPPSKGQQ